MVQLKLQIEGDCEPTTRVSKPERTIHDDFEDYLTANPHVFKLFVELALEAKKAGYHRYSAWPIVNVIRWRTGVQARDPNSEYKINNNYIALLARRAEREVPALKDFFVTREMKR